MRSRRPLFARLGEDWLMLNPEAPIMCERGKVNLTCREDKSNFSFEGKCLKRIEGLKNTYCNHVRALGVTD